MGIQGLLKGLQPAMLPIDITEKYAHRNVRVGIGSCTAGSRFVKVSAMFFADGNSWVHKASYGCAREVVNKLPTDGYILYVLRRVLLLKQAGIEPVVVFDGAKPPLKAEVEAQRNNSRGAEALRGQEYDKKAAQYPKSSPDHRFNRSRADECYQRAVRVNQKMVSAAMHALRAAGVQCLVAPFEADAQLVWLALHKQISAIITEDSDLSVFLVAVGAEAALWFKMTQHGHAWELQVTKQGTQPWADQAKANAAHHADLRLAAQQAAGTAAAPPTPSPSPIADSPPLDESADTVASSALDSSAGSASALSAAAGGAGGDGPLQPHKTPVRRRRLLGSHWTPKAPSRGADLLGLLSRCSAQQYTTVAVLAGCDYLASLPGVGLITAAKLAFKFRTARGLRLVRFVAEHVGKKLRAKGSAPPSDYRRRAAQAIACFKHHLVWDTQNNRVVPLMPLEAEEFQCHDAVGACLPSLGTPPAGAPAGGAGDDDSDSIHSTQSLPEASTDAPCTPPPGAGSDPYAASLRWLRHPSWAFLGSQAEGAVAHRITRGEVHPTSLATISPAKLAPPPGAARSSPGGRGRGGGGARRAAGAAPDPSQRSIMGLFSGPPGKRTSSSRNAPPAFTVAVAGLVSAIARGSSAAAAADAPRSLVPAAGVGSSKPVPRALWGGSGAKTVRSGAPVAAAPTGSSPAPPPASTEPTLPPELAGLLEAGEPVGEGEAPEPAASTAAKTRAPSLASAFASHAGASAGASAGQGDGAERQAGHGPPAAADTQSDFKHHSNAHKVAEDADVVLLSWQSPEAPPTLSAGKRPRAGQAARSSLRGKASSHKARRHSTGTTPAGTRSIASFFGKK